MELLKKYRRLLLVLCVCTVLLLGGVCVWLHTQGIFLPLPDPRDRQTEATTVPSSDEPEETSIETASGEEAGG